MNDADRIRREYLDMQASLAQLDDAASAAAIELCQNLDAVDGLIPELESRGTETDSLLADVCRFAGSFLRSAMLARSMADFQRDAVERFNTN